MGFIATVGAAAGLLAGLPLVRYLFHSRRRQGEWITLGSIDRFAVDETRLAKCNDPLQQPGDPPLYESEVYVRRQQPGDDGAATFPRPGDQLHPRRLRGRLGATVEFVRLPLSSTASFVPTAAGSRVRRGADCFTVPGGLAASSWKSGPSPIAAWKTSATIARGLSDPSGPAAGQRGRWSADLLSPTLQMGRGATNRSPENTAFEVECRAHSKCSYQ